jgi:outer membrane biosynthesis protein TonB
VIELYGKSDERPAALASAEKVLRFPMGAASPLWFMFASAASAGVAYWWMTRWTRPTNLEALLAVEAKAVEAKAEEGVEAMIAVLEAPVVETPVAEAPMIEAAPALEAMAEPVPEPAPAPVAAPVEIPDAPEPVVEPPPAEIETPVVAATDALAEAATPEPAVEAKPKPVAKPKAAAPSERISPRTTSGPSRKS